MQIDSSGSDPLVEAFHRDGFALVPQVFGRTELSDLAEHVFHFHQPPPEELAEYGAEPLDLFGKHALDEFTPHELRRSTRMLRLHLFDERTRRLMLDERLFALVRRLWPGEPLAVHALFFPKPPGARGIALHADTAYLPVDPPHLVGCFIAVDDADSENGALSLVPGSHHLAGAERRPIPTDEYLFPEETIQPAGTELQLMQMCAGDVLMFHGSSLHCSRPNRTTNRWRRAFICHYISAAVRSVSEELNPAFRSTGEEVPAPGHRSSRRVA